MMSVPSTTTFVSFCVLTIQTTNDLEASFTILALILSKKKWSELRKKTISADEIQQLKGS